VRHTHGQRAALALAVATVVAQPAALTVFQRGFTNAKPAADTVPTLSMSSPIGAPDTRVAVTVRLDGAPGEARNVTIELDYPAADLSFVEARSAFSQEFRIETKVTSNPASRDTSRLLVKAASADTIKAEDLFELVFLVAKTLYTDRDVALTAISATLTSPDGQSVDRVKLENGKVQVSVAPVVFGCFFYMH
jgi:hypothetical protein